ncbi:MAG: Flavin-dependent oxidoreductase, luciferase family [Chloroflexi bacterium]|jgi:F420-dependent oxidoreductase-like protein|nr:MAG: Flavin-dependent oxidoreductase, luciferase family [Chloroflexota bacterium]
MRIGLFTGVLSFGATLSEQVAQCVAAEQEGFESIWFTQAMANDTLTSLAAGGLATSTIELGTAVVPLRVPRQPFVLAQQALTTQAAAGGRLTLGLGPVFPGTISTSPEQYMREFLAVLRALAEEGQVDHKGEAFQVAGTLNVPGAQPFPIMLSALRPVMLRVAGELADGTITWMVGPKTLGSHIVPSINAAAQAASRPSPRVCAGVPVAVTADVEKAKETVGRLLERYPRSPHYARMLEMEGAAGPADVAILGDEAEVERGLRRLGEAGATEIMACVMPVEEGAETRTRALLASLVGKI